MRRFIRTKPEAAIREALRGYLRDRGWLVEIMIGNRLQKGIPDLYLCHSKWGSRWVDVKVEGKYEFTRAQIKKWPAWEEKGAGVWILTGATKAQYDRLFSPPNFRDYWKSKYDKRMTIDQAIEEVNSV